MVQKLCNIVPHDLHYVRSIHRDFYINVLDGLIHMLDGWPWDEYQELVKGFSYGYFNIG